MDTPNLVNTDTQTGHASEIDLPTPSDAAHPGDPSDGTPRVVPQETVYGRALPYDQSQLQTESVKAEQNGDEIHNAEVKREHSVASQIGPQFHASEEESDPPLSTEVADADVDEATKTAIQEAQNQFGTRVRRPVKVDHSNAEALNAALRSPPLTTPSPASAMPKNSKKRAIPKNTNKTTTKKPPAKKRKTEAEEDFKASPAPSASGSVSKKASSGNRKASASAAPHLGSSPAPGSRQRSRSASESSVASSVEDPTEVYCICRKPDNHKWMIGCDGGCEDWFHGKCVNLRQEEHEKILDKFICPNCAAAGKGVTTWKPMCRRMGCRMPARLKKGEQSKYCSDECGREFMKRMLERCAAMENRNMPKKVNSNTKRKSGLPANQKTDEKGDSEDLGPMGGTLRAPELHSLVLAVRDVDNFRSLGSVSGSNGPLTPPASAHADSPTMTFDDTLPVEIKSSGQTDSDRLIAITARKSELRERRALLKDREHFVQLAKERAALRAKEFCGFDSRLIWDNDEFRAWRQSEDGTHAFTNNSLGPHPADEGEKLEVPESTTTEKAADGQFDGEGGRTAMCLKKKSCADRGQHREWAKLMLNNLRFEESEVADEMRALNTEEVVIQGKTKESKAAARATTEPDSFSGWVEVLQ